MRRRSSGAGPQSLSRFEMKVQIISKSTERQQHEGPLPPTHLSPSHTTAPIAKLFHAWVSEARWDGQGGRARIVQYGGLPCVLRRAGRRALPPRAWPPAPSHHPPSIPIVDREIWRTGVTRTAASIRQRGSPGIIRIGPLGLPRRLSLFMIKHAGCAAVLMAMVLAGRLGRGRIRVTGHAGRRGHRVRARCSLTVAAPGVQLPPAKQLLFPHFFWMLGLHLPWLASSPSP